VGGTVGRGIKGHHPHGDISPEEKPVWVGAVTESFTYSSLKYFQTYRKVILKNSTKSIPYSLCLNP
jgi:hypothetical protein